MAVKVTVNSVSPNRVSINNQQRTSIRTVGVAPTAGKLENLSDVDASDPDNNEILVYDETLNKYVIKILPNLDGGTF
jgi:hypothetical protein